MFKHLKPFSSIALMGLLLLTLAACGSSAARHRLPRATGYRSATGYRNATGHRSATG